MAMVVKNNMSAISTLNTLNKNSSALAKSLQKVSSGMKINGAADDASGYAISERMRVQIRSLDQANANTQNGSSMMKVAEGAVSSTVDILKTLKEKVIGAANDDKTDSDRATIQKELDQSIDQINDNAAVTYNGKYLVDGSHNQKVRQTTTAMTNQSLNAETTGTTAFTDMTDRNGNKLNIQKLSTVEISFVKEGQTYTTSMQLGAASDGVTGNNGLVSDEANQNLEGLIKLANMEYAEKNQTTATEMQDTGATQAIYASDNTNNGNFGYDKDLVVQKLVQEGYTYQTTMGSNSFGTFQNAWVKGDNNEQVIASSQIQGDGTIASTANGTVTTANVTDTNALAALASNGLATNAAASDIKQTLIDQGYTYNSNNWGNAVATFGSAQIAETGQIATATSVAAQAYITDSDAVAIIGTDAVVNQQAVATVAATDATQAFSEQLGTSDYIGRDAAGDTVTTADKKNALTISAADSGLDNQISGLTITVKNTNGQQQKAINAVLDGFSESIRAQDKSDDNAITLQTGTKAGQSIRVGLTDMRAHALGLQSAEGKNIQIGTQVQANAAINVLDAAVQKALDQQTTIGAVESRLEYTSTNLTTSSENVQASESTIRDADMAKEMTNYTKNNVLLQAAQSMLAQANQNSSAVLSLLQ